MLAHLLPLLLQLLPLLPLPQYFRLLPVAGGFFCEKRRRAVAPQIVAEDQPQDARAEASPGKVRQQGRQIVGAGDADEAAQSGIEVVVVVPVATVAMAVVPPPLRASGSPVLPLLRPADRRERAEVCAGALPY